MQLTCVWRCDERFTGYGGNKAACLFEMYLSGISFYVLSDHFLIHQSHLYEEEARRSEVSVAYLRLNATNILATKRKYNRRIHSDFKEETCLRYVHNFRLACLYWHDIWRYLKRFSDQGILNTTRTSNAKEECKKIKGIGKIVMQVMGFRPK